MKAEGRDRLTMQTSPYRQLMSILHSWLLRLTFETVLQSFCLKQLSHLLAHLCYRTLQSIL